MPSSYDGTCETFKIPLGRQLSLRCLVITIRLEVTDIVGLNGQSLLSLYTVYGSRFGVKPWKLNLLHVVLTIGCLIALFLDGHDFFIRELAYSIDLSAIVLLIHKDRRQFVFDVNL